MSDLQQREQECNVLHWGGISGIIGAVLSILVMVFVIIFLPADPTSPIEWVSRFPDVKVIRIIENIMYLSGLLFLVPLFIALFQSLKRTSLAPSLFGSVLSIIGLTSMIVSSTPHIAHNKISNMYETLAPGAADQSAMAIQWQAIWGITDTLLYIGFFIVPIGFLLLGIAMFNTPTFGKGFGIVSIILGLLGMISGLLQIIDPSSPVGAISYFSIIFYGFIFSLKVYRVFKQTWKSIHN